MAHFVFNIAKGRLFELYHRVNTNVPAGARFVFVPLESAGIESEAVLEDKDTLADVLAGTTNEQLTLGRKSANSTVYTQPVTGYLNDANDLNLLALGSIQYIGGTGNPIARIFMGYDPLGGAGTNADIMACACFETPYIPDGSNWLSPGLQVTVGANPTIYASCVVPTVDAAGNPNGYGPSNSPLGIFYGLSPFPYVYGDYWWFSSIPTGFIPTAKDGGSWALSVALGTPPGAYSLGWTSHVFLSGVEVSGSIPVTVT